MDPIESLSVDPISRLGTLPMHCVDPTASVREAIELMQAEHTGCVLVCDGKKPVGIFTERDVLRHLGTHSPVDTPVFDVASKTVFTIPSEASVADALREMHRR